MPLYDPRALRQLADNTAQPELREWLELRAQGLEASSRKPLTRHQKKQLESECEQLAARLRQLPATSGEIWSLIRDLELGIDVLLTTILEPQGQEAPTVKKRVRWGLETAESQEPPIFQRPGS